MLVSNRMFLRRGMVVAQRRFATTNRLIQQTRWSPLLFASLTAAGLALTATTTTTTTKSDAKIPASGDVIMLGAEKEKATGILFPKQCNGFMLAGTGVRVKYGFVKVYAVGTYLDPLAMSGIKNQPKETVQKALLNPMYPRTIRIVMARGLSIQKFTDALNESLKPRMKGEDLEKLEEFRKLNPDVDLVKGAEMEMTIRGDTLLYKNAVGGVGRIQSQVFTEALCDVYYGDDAVSPGHKDSVLEGIGKL